MNRLWIALLLSLAIHASLALLLPAQEHEAVPGGTIRVSLKELPSAEKTNPAAGSNEIEKRTPDNQTKTPNQPPMSDLPKTAETTSPAKPTDTEKNVKDISQPEPAAAAPTPKPAPAKTKKTADEKPKPPQPAPKPVNKEPPQKQPEPPEKKQEEAPKASAPQEAPNSASPPKSPGISSGGEGDIANETLSSSAGKTGEKQDIPPSSGNRSAVFDVAELTVTKKISPEYPMISRRRKDQGRVVLLVALVSGKVSSVEVERSSGHQTLDESAIKAVKQWRFDTSGLGGPGGRITVRIPFDFKLK